MREERTRLFLAVSKIISFQCHVKNFSDVQQRWLDENGIYAKPHSGGTRKSWRNKKASGAGGG
jgi:hypothetical protein